MSSSSLAPISYRPDLPDWGVYLRWPVAGEDWLHPEEVELARRLLPSRRIWRRQYWDGTYYHLHYGHCRLRVRPSMWLPLPAVDLEVGEQVELLARHGANDPGIYRIADILYAAEEQTVEYYLQGEVLRLNQPFSRQDLKPLHVSHHLRSGYYEHQLPKSRLPPDLELLDVGELTDRNAKRE